MKSRLALAIVLLAPLVLSQDRAPVDVMKLAKDAQSGASVAAWKGTVRNTFDRKGTFIPADAAEIKLNLKVYGGRSELRLTEVVPHGSFVNEGDVIARLDPKAIDKRIEADRMSLERAEMGMRHSDENFRMKSEADAASLARADRDAARASKRLRGYREHEKKFNEESERMGIQRSKHRLEDQGDELEQLEKMYGEDELVDATEEIVLKRSRRNFARSQQGTGLSDKRRVYNKEWYYDWREEDYVAEADKKARALEQLRKKQEMGREGSEAGLKQKRHDLRQQQEKFADLLRDREQFVVRAPRRGILLHGAEDAAPWGRLEKDSMLANRRVFATVADPKTYKVKTDVPETDVMKLKTGTAVEVTPTALKAMKLMGRLEVEYLPGKGNLFEAAVHLGKPAVRLRPGLTCKVTVILEEERDAVLVPKAAVTESGGAMIVRCAKTKDGPYEERKVVTGVTDGKNIAIRDGVAEGEFVAVPKPAQNGRKGK